MKNKYLQQILDLKSQRAQHIAAAAAANEKNDLDTYNTEMQAARSLKAQIDRVQEIVDAMEPPATPTPAPEGDPADEDILASREYHRAFSSVLRRGITRRNARDHAADPDVKIVLDALTEGGGATPGEDGGFLVPVDLQTRINELTRAFHPLSALFNAESVTAPTGFRVIDTAPTTGFAKIDEMAEIPMDDQPAFRRISYKIEDYALILPVSNDLLDDNTAGLYQYLARWFARKSVITENILLYSLLSALTPAAAEAGKELAAIKRALNVTLDPAISLRASIITNQTGIDILDNLVDANNRPLLQPDPTQPTRMMCKGRPIHVYSNAQIPDLDGGAPVFIGDGEEFATLFRAKSLEVAATNIGGNAWRTNSTEIRGITRLDAMDFDTEAMTLITLPVA